MELINFPTGLPVEVQVNWSSSGNWWYACFLYLVCDLMGSKSCLLQLSGIVYLKSSGSGHGTTAARDRGAFFFWPTSGLHHSLSFSLSPLQRQWGIPAWIQIHDWPLDSLVTSTSSISNFSCYWFFLSHCLPRTLSCLNSAFVLRNFSPSPSSIQRHVHTMSTNSIKLLTGNSHPELAKLVADRYDCSEHVLYGLVD